MTCKELNRRWVEMGTEDIWAECGRSTRQPGDGPFRAGEKAAGHTRPGLRLLPTFP